MMSGSAANRIAALIAGAAALLAIGFLRIRGIPVLVGAGAVYLGTLALLWPKPRTTRVILPKGIRKRDFIGVEKALSEGADLLRQYARLGDVREARLFNRLADGTTRILDHLRANPSHLPVIHRFTRHGLARLIQMITDYAELKRRALPEHQDRLAQILKGLEAFLPALDRIDKACLENDLDALEISVEVMAEQIDRSRSS